MKTFLKIFIVSFAFIFIAYSLGGYLSLRNNDIGPQDYIGMDDGTKLNNEIINTREKEIESKEQMEFKDLDTALKESPRINFLILGLEDIRTDTMILASFDREAKILDLISIPRDTYLHRRGYDKGPERKINIIYHSNGIEGVKQGVEHILNIAIDNHIIVDYEGVKDVVDLVGGVEVEVPFHMKYDDLKADPPLHIDLKPGKQVLNGEDALNFIRWRKNNDNKTNYIDGDLGRIKAQHDFLKSLLSKSKDNIVTLVRNGFDYVEMDLNIFETITLAKDGYGIKDKDIRFYTIPGEHEFRTINGVLNSYYIYNKDEIVNLIENIYNVKKHP